MALVMDVYEKVEGIIGGGVDGVLGLLNNARELAYNADALIADALAAGAQALVEPLTTAALRFVVEKLATGPGLGAVASLYRGLTWLLDPQTADQLQGVVGAAIDGVRAVARGEAGANLATTIETALLGGIPLALNFAVKQVPGLETLPKKVVDSLQGVSNKLEARLKTLFGSLKTTLQAKLKPPAGLIGKVHQITVGTETHTLWLAQTPGGPLRIMLDGIGDTQALDLEADLPESLSAEMRQKVRAAVKAVLTYGEELKTLLGSKPPKLKEAQTLQAETGFLGQAIARLADALVGAPCKRLLAACFCAGTMLRTPGGLQAIETLKVGDRVLSRDEHDRSSANDYKVVEEVFERLGRVWHLTAGGRLIRTTGEHPFQEATKGWIACFQLAAGDRLVCEDGSTVLVEAVVDTGTVEVVYNLRVADWHTYFVGGEDWGFSVWAHNAYYVIQEKSNGKWAVNLGGSSAITVAEFRTQAEAQRHLDWLPKGEAAPIFGQFWRTSSKTPGHTEVGNFLAKQAAESGLYEQVYLGISVEVITSHPTMPRRAPDVVGVRKDSGVIDIWEVESASDNAYDLMNRGIQVQSQLPEHLRGRVVVARPQGIVKDIAGANNKGAYLSPPRTSADADAAFVAPDAVANGFIIVTWR
ncbi:MAG: HINT domain-containing protein [Bacteroidales bacterium]|nr:HINT domain-containing protein [Bacteroidales bacterium]